MSAGRLQRALARSAARAGAAVAIERHRAVAWHSATFTGDRHELVLAGRSDPRLDAWLDSLDADSLALPGHVLAELRVVARACEAGATHARLEGVTVAAG
ncbi:MULTISPECIES: hypothetical protein [unclassified Sphingomonas]|uniref:hypothetical protein n=1 Tax=unclassified Sphingomonas TaxID=196159 RepID=UPI00160EA4CE|nr:MULTISPECIES: hypothetical protein [unclassified Sphingomonas]MBB3348665.1 hypothetical protein [Sphingomonas sp. BK069]MBB3474237.1 hypothetical protein [Sphingomonas sp. BK345]